MKAMNVMILSVLVVIAALLGALEWRLNHPVTPSAEPAPPVETAALPPPAPAPAPAPVSAKPKAKSPEHSAKKSMVAKASTPTSDYTQQNPPIYAPLPIAPPPAQTPTPAAADAQPMPFPATAQAPAVPPPPQKLAVTLPAGSTWTVRLSQALNSENVATGNAFRATIDDPIYFQGKIVIPRGSTVLGRVVSVQKQGRVSGQAELALELKSVQLGSTNTINLATETLTRQGGEASAGQDATKVGAGGAIGAIIGAIAGGGKGAAIGAVTGAGAGGATAALTRNKPVVLAAETRLSFQLHDPVNFEIAPSADAEYAPQPTPYSSDPSRPQLLRRPAAADGGGLL